MLEGCKRQHKPNPVQCLLHNVSLAAPGTAVVCNPAQELIHTQREAKSQITSKKCGHRGHQEQRENEDLCLTVMEMHQWILAPISHQCSTAEVPVTRFGFWESNYWKKKNKGERKINKIIPNVLQRLCSLIFCV